MVLLIITYLRIAQSAQNVISKSVFQLKGFFSHRWIIVFYEQVHTINFIYMYLFIWIINRWTSTWIVMIKKHEKAKKGAMAFSASAHMYLVLCHPRTCGSLSLRDPGPFTRGHPYLIRTIQGSEEELLHIYKNVKDGEATWSNFHFSDLFFPKRPTFEFTWLQGGWLVCMYVWYSLQTIKGSYKARGSAKRLLFLVFPMYSNFDF